MSQATVRSQVITCDLQNVPRASGIDAPARQNVPSYPWWVRGRAWIGILVLIPFGAAAALSKPWGPTGSLTEILWEATAWVLLIAGTAMRFWATLYIGGHKGRRLACEGPYSLCRNPLYFGTCLIALSVAAFLQSTIFAVGVAIASLLYLSTTIAVEERRLREELGTEYIEYCARVPRFWPRWSGFRTSPMVEVNVHGLYCEFLRSLQWIAIPLIGEIATYVRELIL